MDPAELVEATGHEYNTMPNAVKAELQRIEDGAFDEDNIAATICDQIVFRGYILFVSNESCGVAG